MALGILGDRGRDSTNIPGLLQMGNINLHTRPTAKNKDGSISTVRSITVTGDNGQAILLPTVVAGKVVPNDQAIKHYQQTGEHLGVFDNEDSANSFAERLHQAQADEYDPGTGVSRLQSRTDSAQAGLLAALQQRRQGIAPMGVPGMH